MPRRVLEDGLDADRLRRRHGLAAGQLGPAHRGFQQRVRRQLLGRHHYRYVGQDDPALFLPPRCRVDYEWLAWLPLYDTEARAEEPGRAGDAATHTGRA